LDLNWQVAEVRTLQKIILMRIFCESQEDIICPCVETRVERQASFDESALDQFWDLRDPLEPVRPCLGNIYGSLHAHNFSGKRFSPDSVRHLALPLLFVTFGLIMGTWAGRIPALRDSAEASPSTLSFVLLCGGLGAVISFPVSFRMMRILGGATHPAVFRHGAALRPHLHWTVPDDSLVDVLSLDARHHGQLL
jgi:hypothetical protein